MDELIIALVYKNFAFKVVEDNEEVCLAFASAAYQMANAIGLENCETIRDAVLCAFGILSNENRAAASAMPTDVRTKLIGYSVDFSNESEAKIFYGFAEADLDALFRACEEKAITEGIKEGR